jgi:hypothetical protein
MLISGASMGSSAKAPTQSQAATVAKVIVREHQGDRVVTYERDADGRVTTSGNGSSDASWPVRTRRKLWESLVPENITNTVSKDYVATRKWQVARDAFGAFAGTASVTAAVSAIGGANSALLALGIAGVTLANVTWVKDRLAQLTTFSSTGLAKVAEKNPRPWILAADIVNNAGAVIDATTALLPPVVYYPLITGMAVVRAAIGTAEGAAGAGIAPRQAIADNIGEVGVKNANQSTIATTLGATASLVALGTLTAAIGFGPAAIAIAATGAAAGLFCKYKMLQNLDYNPINEGAVRRVISGLEQDGQVVGPAESLLSQLPSIFKRNTLVVGDSVAPLLDDPNFPKLRELFQTRPYILSVQDGAPHIVLKDDLESSLDTPKAAEPGLPAGPDYARKMVEVQAAYQAVQVEKLLAGDEYQQRVRRDGADQADLWVAQESLQRTPDNLQPLLLDMKAHGWSVDTVRFNGESRPVELGEPSMEIKRALVDIQEVQQGRGI